MARVHYLRWDRDDNDEARDLFTDLHVTSIEETPISLPKNHYQKITTLPGENNLEQHFRKMNRGLGVESEAFTELFECHTCRTILQNADDAHEHAVDEHDCTSDDALPEFITGVRSLSVGDVIEQDNDLKMVAALGFLDAEWADK